MERTIKAGSESSEFAQVRRAQFVAFVLLAIGVVAAVVGAILDRWVPVLAGVGLAYVGGEVLEKTVAAYAHGRAAVKAAQASPPTTVVNPDVTIQAAKPRL